MKYYFFILLLYQIFFVKAPIPVWNFNNQAIDLLASSDEHYYDIYQKKYDSLTVTLWKKIIKENDVFFYNKTYVAVGEENKEVDFEDIESHYPNQLGVDIVVCPRGKFHPYDFKSNSFIAPDDKFEEKGDWDLSCYNHKSKHFLIFYLNNENYNFYSKCSVCSESRIKKFYFGNVIYDYQILENWDAGSDENYDFKSPSLLKDGKLKLFGTTIIMKTNDHNCNRQSPAGSKEASDVKQYTQAYFDNDNKQYFRFFTYNDVTDFTSGYYYVKIDTSNYDSNNLKITSTNNNPDSPLSFTDNVEIKEMKFIRGTKYVYYKIYNMDKKNYYYGLIDIELNEVLYNFDEEITTFIPYITKADRGKYGEMLAITPTSAYKICIVKSGNSCVNLCSTLKRDIDGNKCQNNCEENKIQLMPDNICIEKSSCNLTIYILNSLQTICGLCSYFNPDGAKYRLIGAEGCLSSIPSNSEFYNENLYLLKCKTGYHLDSNSCVPDTCYEKCETCSEVSTNEDDQKCTSCQSGYKLVSGNCIIPPTTIVTQAPTTIYIPPTTIYTPPSTFYTPPSTEFTPPTTINIPPTTVYTPLTTIITESPTTVLENIPTTIITESPSTQPLEVPSTNCENKRCKECNTESNEMKLCISCDESYEKVNYTRIFSKYFDCVKKENLQNKYYKDTSSNQYKPCYEKCKKCSGPGNATSHNCLECDVNYMFRPGDNPHNNCVVYSEFYYLSPYGEYKPLNSPQCPEEAKFKINNEEDQKIACIYDCKMDKVYKYLYNGNCIKSCSEIEGTQNVSFICKETNINNIYVSENPIYLNKNDSIKDLQTLAMTYAQEFNYTNKHISVYKNNEITVAFYKNKNIIDDTNLTLPNIDFGDCYEKVKNFYNITEENLIIAIADKKVKNHPSTFYLFFDPETGRKLDAGEICKNETIEVKENLLNMLDTKNENYDLQVSLTKQGINIFDINDPYYKDICYDFENPKKRDIALKDRIQETFVNVTLCDDGCVNTGIDVTNNEATCNCKFNDVTNNDLIHENAALEYLVGEVFDFINSSNIMVLKCYKYIFKHFKRSYGAILVLSLFGLSTIFALIFYLIELTKMKRYIFTLTEKFSAFLLEYPNLAKFFPPKKRNIKNNEEKVIKFPNQNDDEEKLKNLHKNNKSSTRRTINNLPNIKQSINSENLIINNKKGTFIGIKEKQNAEIITNDINKGKAIKKYFKEYLSTSPDEMEYDDAIKKDKRSFGRYFLDSLEEKQSLAYTFFASDPINTRMIKLILFFLNINLYFVVCGLFFSESYISELYNINEEDENFFSFIPRTIDKIIYTTLVTGFIGYLTDFFFLNEKKIKGIFKREKDNRVVLKRSITLLIGEIQKRYTSFIIMSFVIFVISFYYILCFNYVYPKTQIEWIKSSILIIIIMQILSILKCLFETIFRILSFKCESEKLYKISKLFEKDS